MEAFPCIDDLCCHAAKTANDCSAGKLVPNGVESIVRPFKGVRTSCAEHEAKVGKCIEG